MSKIQTIGDSIEQCVPVGFRNLFAHRDGSTEFLDISTDHEGGVMDDVTIGETVHALLSEASEMAAHLPDLADHTPLWEMVSEQCLTIIYG